jgi:two-component system, cell cycle response regulator DivK
LLTGEGYDVRTAVDALEALEILKKWRPLLILMDIQLPGIDGLELTRRLKADSTTEQIIIIGLTAYAMKGDEERILAAGCDGYIAKPIDTRTLPHLIATLIEKSSPL